MLKEYTKSKLNNLKPSIIKKMKNVYNANFPSSSLSEHLETIVKYSPSHLLIINYNSFDNEIKKLLKLFHSSNLFEKREYL